MASKQLLKRSYQNLEMYLLYKKEICGHNSNYLHMVPETTLSDQGILYSLRRIEASLLAIKYSRHVVMDQLKIILSALKNTESNKAKASAELLNKYEGTKILFSLLCATDLGSKCCDLDNCNRNYTISDIKLSTTSIFQRLVFLDVSIADMLSKSAEFLHVLFSLLGDMSTSSCAATLIEHLFIYRKGAIDLYTIPGLVRFIAQLHGRGFTNVCSIFSLTISGSAMSDTHPYLCHQKKDQESSRLVAINRRFVLAIPGFLSRLVDYATRLPYAPRYEGFYIEKDHWMRFVDSITDVIRRPSSTSPNGPESSVDFSVGHSLQEMAEPMFHRQEPLSVLRLLLQGDQGNEVRAQLANLGLIPRLSELFDHFLWSCSDCRRRPRVSLHHKSYEYSPEASLKMHFLQVLYDFCDHSEYKYLMLTPTEYQELCELGAQSNGSPNQYPPELMCSGSQGLLSKIAANLRREDPTSQLRFWFSRVLESYLRNSTHVGDQMFLLNRGLLEHLVDSSLVVDVGPHRDGLLQSSFDLIGELLKFNPEAFRRLDRCWFTERKQSKFFSLVENNLVDSNLLVRSLVLSYDRFTGEGGSLEQYTAESALLRTVGTFDKRLRLLTGLLKISKVTKLTQENVSCLNTALVILIVQRHRSELPKYLEALQNVGIDRFLSHLRSLLLFWQTHYKDDKGCNPLHRIAGISVGFWEETIATLVAEDESDPNCIFHYLASDEG